MLLQGLSADLKTAMKARESERVGLIRLVLAEIQNARIAKGSELTEEEIAAVLKRGIKSRTESIEQFRRAGREDLATHEEREAAMLRTYLPEPLTGADLARIVDETVQRLGASTMKDMGMVMKEVLGAHAARVDGKELQALVRGHLGG